MTSPNPTSAAPTVRRTNTRPEARLQIDAVFPLDRHHTADELIEHITREVMWQFNAEDVTVTEVER